ncbi:uncharacterized protein JN550_010527 [Neoarthrinium moseri]|uniref:uncharacterized protein n=1 Tax=Neoarthrinium moseri TaxID=1658444 RepID=UPI001FDDA6C5|nr:uncharacterized protein JN550_010527 [Neoarthrinium moseri]KAI1862062.1 hypothetical protein JN550_010527 [Neoarthrinium moseri]
MSTSHIEYNYFDDSRAESSISSQGERVSSSSNDAYPNYPNCHDSMLSSQNGDIERRHPTVKWREALTSSSNRYELLTWLEDTPFVRRRGPPSDVISQCPGSRPLKYSTIWYRFIDEPDFLACSVCYEQSIKGTALSHAFLRFQSEGGVPMRCRFCVPRMASHLWPDAVARHDLDEVTEYAMRRVHIQDCKGNKETAACGVLLWYQPSDERTPSFLCCQACYEDQVQGTSFARHFAPSAKGPDFDESGICHVSLPFITGALSFFAAAGDWAGFKAAVHRRLQAPVCKGRLAEHHKHHWFTVPELDRGLWICEACYLDRVSFTPFDAHFERGTNDAASSSSTTTDGIRMCGLSSGPFIVAFESAIAGEDFRIFLNAAKVVMSNQRCDTETIDGPWYTPDDAPGMFHVCQSCYAGIIATCEMGPFFNITTQKPKAEITCDLRPSTPRYLLYVEKLAQAAEVGDFSIFSDFVHRISGAPPCPGRTALPNAIWYTADSCTICPECHESTVRETVLANKVALQYHPNWKICGLGSRRMKGLWAAACGDRSLQDFVACCQSRIKVYASTIAVVDTIKQAKMARMDLAMTYAALGTAYLALGRRISQRSRGTEVADDSPEYAAESSKMTDMMLKMMAHANCGYEWRLINQLEARWEEVE